MLGPEKQVEVHARPMQGKFTHRVVHGPGGILSSGVFPGFTVDLSELFAK